MNEPACDGSAPSNSGDHSRLPSVRVFLPNAPKLPEDEWKALRVNIIESTPAKRRELVRYLLWRCGRKAVCWPTDESIAGHLDCCERTVRTILNELDELGITQRLSVPIRHRRVIFFTAHPAFVETLTGVKEAGNFCRPNPAIFAAPTRQFLPEKPLTVEREKFETPEWNSREDGGTNEISLLGTANGKTGGALAPLAGEVAPLPTVPLEKNTAESAFASVHALAMPVLAGETTQAMPGDAPAPVTDGSDVPAPSHPRAQAAGPSPGEIAVEQLRRRKAGEAMFQPQDEMVICRLFGSLGRGSTDRETQRVALSVATILDDRHSVKYWRLVADLARHKGIWLGAFTEVAGTSAKPAAVIASRLQPTIKAAKAERQACKERHSRRKGVRP